MQYSLLSDRGQVLDESITSLRNVLARRVVLEFGDTLRRAVVKHQRWLRVSVDSSAGQGEEHPSDVVCERYN
jgi:hypothetical protein